MKKYILFLVLLVINVVHSQSQKFDHSLFDNLLKANVNNAGLVNYKAFANNDKFAENIAAILPPNTVHLDFALSGETRTITLRK